jgi:hypothetical protein
MTRRGVTDGLGMGADECGSVPGTLTSTQFRSPNRAVPGDKLKPQEQQELLRRLASPSWNKVRAAPPPSRPSAQLPAQN